MYIIICTLRSHEALYTQPLYVIDIFSPSNKMIRNLLLMYIIAGIYIPKK